MMGAKNNKKEEKKTKSFVDSNGNIRTVETTPEQDEMDKARDAAYVKYFKDKPTKKKAGGKITVNGFSKMNLGEGIEKREDNLADEVAKMTKA